MAYEMRISDWSSDGCSSDLCLDRRRGGGADRRFGMKGQGRHRGEAGRSQQGLAHEIPLVIVRERPPGTIARRNGAHAALENIWRAFPSIATSRHAERSRVRQNGGRSDKRRVGKEGGSTGRSG